MRSSIHWKRGRRKVKSRMSSLHFTRVSILPMCPLPAANPVRRIFTTPSPKCHTQGRGLSRWVYVKSTRHYPYVTHPLSNLFPYRSQLPGGKLLPVGSLGQYGILFWYTERDSLEVFLAVVSTFGPQSCSGLASLNLRKSRVGLSEKLKFTSQLRSIMRLTTVIDSPR